MSGKTLLFIHASLGTLGIFAAQQAEEFAKNYLAILLLLDWCADYYQKRSQRRFKEAGLIDGCWLEKSTMNPQQEPDIGAFIEIKHSAETGFTVEGELFDRLGKHSGRFDGHGTPNPDGRILNSTGWLRHASGKRTGKLPKSLPIDRRLEEKGKRVVEYLGAS
jgi:hypothetical protein